MHTKRVRAVIIQDKKILTIKRTKFDIIYWVIPGGGVEENETNERALVREVKEELGLDIKVKELILKMISKKPETIGQEEYFYLCDIVGGEIGSGNGPEFDRDTKYVGQYDFEWIDIEELNNCDLKPEDIKKQLERLKGRHW
ncbi:MAG: NUDIX domain-containing protein [Patescibacteria group bacterium]|nr:NUDIX domain-containing protein [Patescibacteria group bacterium]